MTAPIPTHPDSGPQHIGFVLLPDFPMLAFAACCDPLRMANYAAGRELYRWSTFGIGGDHVSSSAGVVTVADHRLEQLRGDDSFNDLDTVILIGGRGIETFDDRNVLTILQQLALRNIRLGAVSVASYVLARAGLLDGYRFTVHWENLDAFREEFPALSVTPDLYEIDRDRLTASGGTASLDLMLAMINLSHGLEFASAVSDLHIHHGLRDNVAIPRMPLRLRFGVSHPKLLEAIALIEADTENSFDRTTLAETVGLSGRQLERLFRQYMHTTPRRYHLEVRLTRARRLLQQTSMPVLDIAVACGFTTASHFAKSYRARYSCQPSADRLLADNGRYWSAARESS